jgi:hypothetical protein
MSVQVTVPFALDPNGAISKRTDENLQAFDRVQALVNTQPGERVMLPNYGIRATELVWEPDVSIVSNELTQQLAYQSALWEPNLDIRISRLPESPDEGTAGIEFDYSIKTGPTTGNQYAVIGPSGVLLQKTLRV